MARSGSKVVQIGPKWDKSGTFSDHISVQFGSVSQNVLKFDLKDKLNIVKKLKMENYLIWKSSRFVPFRSNRIWTTLGPNLASLKDKIIQLSCFSCLSVRYVNKCATAIQRRWRGFLGRRFFRILLKVLTVFLSSEWLSTLDI